MCIGAVSGFCNMIYKLVKNGDQKNLPSHIAIVFDHKGKTFRSNIYPNYKLIDHITKSRYSTNW